MLSGLWINSSVCVCVRAPQISHFFFPCDANPSFTYFPLCSYVRLVLSKTRKHFCLARVVGLSLQTLLGWN